MPRPKRRSESAAVPPAKRARAREQPAQLQVDRSLAAEPPSQSSSSKKPAIAKEDTTLVIRPVPKIKIPDSEMDKINPLIPKPPFALGLIAPKGSGKSTVIHNLLARPEFYYKRFDQVWMLSPTFYLDDTYAKLRLDKSRIVVKTQLFTDTMKKIIEGVDRQIDAIRTRVNMQAISMGWDRDQIDDEIEKEKHKTLDRILIVIDDAVGVDALKKGSLITDAFSRHRHLYISFLYAIQVYKAMPPVVRNNLSACIFFRIYNKQELKKITEEQATLVCDKTWLALYNHATAEPYNFLYVNYKQDSDYTYFKNFTTPLVVQRE